MLKADIERDLKKAMIARDKSLVSILRSIKSAFLYKEVADGTREQGLDDEAVLVVLKKERKSRMDALKMYQDAGEVPRAEEESYQISVIEKYLPQQMNEKQATELVVSVIEGMNLEEVSMKNMGQIMSTAKQQASNIDGGMLSAIVKNIINKG